MSDDANLGEAISQMVAKKLDAAFVEKVVDARIDKLVSEAVDSALRSYSDTGKLIEKAVSEALRVDRLDLPSYGATVTKILKAQIEARVAPLVAGRLAEDMEELLNLAPKEIRLSKIAEDMIRMHHSEDAYGEVITVILGEASHWSRWLWLDEEHHYSEREKYQCRHQLLIRDDGTISCATVDKKDLKDTKTIGRDYGLGQMIRAWVACGTKIILDEGAVVTSVGDY